MEVYRAIYSRRAVRDYAAAPVDRQTLIKLIDAAVQAPSAMNEQSWAFTVVQDTQLLGKISREAKAHLMSQPPSGIHQHHLNELLSNPDFDIFYHAPVLILISSTTGAAWALENCALAAENLMLAACAEGLGTCWIGLAQGWLATPVGHAELGLPASYLPVAPIIVGRPKSEPAPVARKPAEIRWVGP